jgi:hypothetical protein
MNERTRIAINAELKSIESARNVLTGGDGIGKALS